MTPRSIRSPLVAGGGNPNSVHSSTAECGDPARAGVGVD